MMDYCSNTPLNHDLVNINQILMEALETRAQFTSYNRNLFVHEKQGKEENHMGTKPLLKNGHGDENKKVNGIHHHASLTPINYLK